MGVGMMMQVIKCLCGILGVAAVGDITGAVYFFQKTLLREEPIGVTRPQALIGAGWKPYFAKIKTERTWLRRQKPESVSLKTEDGLILKGLWLKSKVPSDKLIVGIHGYRGRGENDFAALAHFYHDKGYNVLLIDQRAHGCSEGKYISLGILDYKDLKKWLLYAIKRLGEGSSIYLHGISTGAAAAILMADQVIPEEVKGIIADSAFTSPWEVVKHELKTKYHLPTFPTLYITNELARKYAGYALDTMNMEEYVEQTRLPILFIHGSQDDFAPVSMSKRLYAKCQGEKMLLVIQGAGHGQGYYKAPGQYQQAVEAFLEKCQEGQAQEPQKMLLRF